MVYHPGRVLKVFAAQTKAGETAATIRFWDNNLHTVKVSKDIASYLKEGDMVLVDYYPVSESLNRPRMEAMSIVNKKDENELWEHYKQFLDLKKRAMMMQAKQQGSGPQRPPIGVG